MERDYRTHQHWAARLARQVVIILPLALLAVGVAVMVAG